MLEFGMIGLIPLTIRDMGFLLSKCDLGESDGAWGSEVVWLKERKLKRRLGAVRHGPQGEDVLEYCQCGVLHRVIWTRLRISPTYRWQVLMPNRGATIAKSRPSCVGAPWRILQSKSA